MKQKKKKISMNFIVTWFSPGIPVSLPNVEYEALSLLFPTAEKRKEKVLRKREGEVLRAAPCARRAGASRRGAQPALPTRRPPPPAEVTASRHSLLLKQELF